MDSRQKLVIADDEPALRLLAVAVFAGEPYELFQASDGAEALEAVRREHPAVALLDVRMPKLDGLEVCRQIKADAGLAGTKVVLMTGDPSDREAGFSAGADAFVAKPFNPPELIEVVNRTIAEG